MNHDGVPEPKIEYAPKHYMCKRAPETLKLDGRLDKPFWADAVWTDDFVDIEGDLRPLPTKQTRVKMLWDEEYFYFGAEMKEDQIWATLTERDSVIFYDNDFEIFIDPDGDSHQYYEFEINALNTVWDLLLVKPYRDGGPPVDGWDIQDLKTAVYIDGELNNPNANNRMWSVEVAIPWKSIRECAPERRMPNVGEFWRVNFSRVQWQAEVKDGQFTKVINPETGKSYPEDNWVWSPMGLINMHYPELWGYVEFIDEAGPTMFEMPQDERVKWELRKLYYRERNYYASHGEFAKDMALLQGEDTWCINPVIETTSRLFQMSAPSTDGQSRFLIREDGKLWKECQK
ncbi:carbohydrate-binding family 9-like protein [Paenibacillus sp. N1-5-1-14]|uniref:carbohydrate-binding family 9-like protein n=1 Tax=Paenibacillus radicibacter TaxID=2972488 RepID=UPI00215949E2|nr:carbohydrate-binding family 9-like protein [Paenibacillus radicibacter]MCR8641130.1 carbohydrate-binding family 9-like protein [Paenibacillus radicibacter]